MNPSKEKFDAVKMMRDIRDKMSAEYNAHPQKEDKDLIEIRKKYSIPKKSPKTSNASL